MIPFNNSRRRGAAALAFAITVAAAVSFLPHASAARAAAADPVITVTAGGDRSDGTAVTGLDGVRFDFYPGERGTPPGPGSVPVASCVTGTAGVTGRCHVDVPARAGGSGGKEAGYWIVQAAVPAGWFADPALDTGAAGSITTTDYARLFVGGVTTDLSVPVPVTNNSKTATARGGVWAASRDNPPLPGRCGLKVALIFDLSGSIGSNIGQLKAAGKSFVDALTGTPSSVGIYTFASNAPANTANNGNLGLTSVSTPDSAARLTAKIAGLTVQTSANATNWDQGLWQVAADPTRYDVAIVLTDGNPTVYGPAAQGPGSYTRFIEVENGIFSANALKAKGTTVLGVGIGNVGKSRGNLAAISGPREGTDYFATSFTDLGPLLTALALKNCQGTVNVVKQVVPASAPGDLGAASPAPGWQFSAGPAGVQPPRGVTDENGAISFATATSGSQPVTIAETEQPGYQLIQQDGKNATCHNSAGQRVPVHDAAQPPGFTVDAVANQSVTCEVYNQEPARPDPASVVVTKTWTIDGVTVPQGDQDPDFQAALTLDPVHPPGSQPDWGQPQDGYLAGDTVQVGETGVTIPPGCTSDPSGDLGPHTLGPGLNTFHVTNTVTCDTQLTLIKQISNPFPGATPAPLDSWMLTASTAEGQPPVLIGTTGVTGSIAAGTSYLLAETSVPGYQQEVEPGSTLAPGATGSWQCVQQLGGGQTGLEDLGGADGTVTVPPGQHVACTAVNDPQMAALTLVKHVVNSRGGTAQPTEWTLTATPGEDSTPPAPAPSGPTGSAAVTGAAIPPGVPYRLAETGPPGYTLTSLSCADTASGTPVPLRDDELTAAIGQDITCTFTNTEAAPTPEPTTPRPTTPRPSPPTPRPTTPRPTPPTPRPTTPRPTPPTPRPTPPTPEPTTPQPTTPTPRPTGTRPPTRPPTARPSYPMPSGGAGTGGGLTSGGLTAPLLAGGLAIASIGAATGVAALRRRRRGGAG